MRLLYLTRQWTAHDHRFVREFGRRQVSTGVALLGAEAPHAAGEIGGEKAEFLGALGIGSFDVPGATEAGVSAYRRLEEQFEPDVVLAGPLTDCAFLKSQARTAVPWVAQSWAFDVFWEASRNREARSRVHSALQASQGLFADCRAVLQQCAQIAPGAGGPTFCMPWGLEAQPALGPSAREKIRGEVEAGDRKIVLHTRGFEAIYAPETLISAWIGLGSYTQGALLILASEGSLRGKVEQMIAAGGASESVRILGRVPPQRIAELMAAADVYVSSSACDGTSVSLLEAMGSGVVPIVSERGGSPEWIESGPGGWVVPFGEVDALRAALQGALDLDPRARSAIVQRNMRLIAQRADWERNFPDFVKFLADRAGR